MLEQFLKQAISAYSGISFSPERRGEQVISDYERELEADLKDIEAASEEVKAEYIKRYKNHFSHYLSAKSRVLSPMITGPANFPVRRMEKYRNWEDNAYQKFNDFRSKAKEGIRRQIERDKPKEVKEAEVWAKIEKHIVRSIQNINDIDEGRYSGSRPLFVQNLTGFIKRMANNGQTEHIRKSLQMIREYNANNKKPIVTEKHKIFSLVSVAEEIQEAKEEVKETTEENINGVILRKNYEAGRIQLIFDSIPDPEMRTKLKQNGFRWSPSNMAWQRFLNNQSYWAAKRVLGDVEDKEPFQVDVTEFDTRKLFHSVDEANEFMTKNAGYGVLKSNEDHTEIWVAHKDDLGKNNKKK